MLPYDPQYAIKQMKKQEHQQQLQSRSQTQNMFGPSRSINTNELDRQMMPMNNFSSVQSQHNNIFHEMQEMSSKMERRMQKAFTQFDNFGFGGGIARDFDMFSGISKQMDSMFKFSGMHDDILKSHSGPGMCVQRSYVNSTKLDNDGRKYEEKYFSNNVAQKGIDGNTISERQQGYQNSKNQQQRIAQERMLNDQGRKIVQERFGRNGAIEKTDLFYNLDEGQKNNFDQRWMDYDQKIGFTQNSQKYLGGSPNYKYIAPQQTQPQYYSDPYYSEKQTKSKSFKDNYRRGDFIPSYQKLPNQPVQYRPLNNQDDEYHGRVRATDLQPTYVGGNPQPLPPNNGRVIGQGELHQQNQAIPLGAPQRQQTFGRRNGGANAGVRDGVFRNNPGKSELPKAG